MTSPMCAQHVAVIAAFDTVPAVHLRSPMRFSPVLAVPAYHQQSMLLAIVVRPTSGPFATTCIYLPPTKWHQPWLPPL